MSDKAVVVDDVVIVCAIVIAFNVLAVVTNDCVVVELFAFKKLFPPLTTVRALLLANMFPPENVVIVVILPFVVAFELIN